MKRKYKIIQDGREVIYHISDESLLVGVVYSVAESEKEEMESWLKMEGFEINDDGTRKDSDGLDSRMYG